MVPSGRGGEQQLLRTGLRQGVGRYPQEWLVSGRLARERQLLHPLKVRSCEHLGITGAFQVIAKPGRTRAGPACRMMTAAPLAAKNKYLAKRTEREARASSGSHCSAAHIDRRHDEYDKR
jgi:hypothetical protein